MVKRIYPNSSDFENLSRLRTEVAPAANNFDYSQVVVRKPWGYEYLWHQSAAVAVWMLHLTAGAGTSMHCHARKRTSLIVMAGAVECSTFDDRHRLGPGQAVVLEPCVFHTTLAVADGGAVVMEVETPPLKGDLMRFRDNFGRAGKGYEDASQCSTDLAAFDYAPLQNISHGGAGFKFKQTRLQYRSFSSGAELTAHLRPEGLVVPFLGQLAMGRKLVADIGEAVSVQKLSGNKLPPEFPPVELLQVSCA
ncbi:MAG: hypothetical protein K9M98_04335 [Cephaloticoccus sp.]|nr:hypothetical protein [Cephaloticoccus sp.]MCF7759712.1 hypothetical protein [Cephaloticoccus sp.]